MPPLALVTLYVFPFSSCMFSGSSVSCDDGDEERMARGDALAMHGIKTVEVHAMTSSLLVQPVSVTSHLSRNANPNDAVALRSREVVRGNGGSQPRIFSWTPPLPTGLLCRQRGWGWNLILPSLVS